jgi:hypothetical protein
LYVIIAFGLLLLSLSYSRFIVQRIAFKSGIAAALRRRILFVDWTEKTARIARAAISDRWNPYELVACAPNTRNRFTSQPPGSIPALRSYHDVGSLCERGLVDIVILALPIPFDNFFPAWAIFFFCLALIEDDGVMAMLGWVLTLVTVVWTIFLLMVGHAAIMAAVSTIKDAVF